VERHQHDAGEVGRWEEVDDPEQIPDRGAGQVDRVARVVDHPHADHPLAGSLTVAVGFEEREVPPDQRELGDDRGDPGEPAVDRQEPDRQHHGQGDQAQDRGVDQGRQSP